MRKLYCVNKAIPTLPINIEDAARSEEEIEKALKVCFLAVYMFLHVYPGTWRNIFPFIMHIFQCF